MAAKKINDTNSGKGDSSKTFSFSSTAANSDIKVAADVNKGLRQTGVKSGGESGGKSGGKSSASSTGRSDDLTLQAMLYMGLLAIQFAVQPVFSAKYKPGPGIDKTLVVMCTEFLKCCIAIFMLFSSSPTTRDFRAVISTWTLQDWIKTSGLPAVLYAVQNVFLLLAYENLTAVEFSVINQTKTVSAAVFCFVLMGRRQTAIQMSALLMLGVGAICIEGTIDVSGAVKSLYETGTLGSGTGNVTDFDANRMFKGVVPCLIASGISGLAGAITQKILQAGKGGKALGGILVGLVTKYAGSVRKGFALIGGILLTAMMQSFAYDKKLTANQEIGGILAVCAMYTHANFGEGWKDKYKIDKKRTQKKTQREINVGGKKLFDVNNKGGGNKVKEQ
ncbi:hypothetical protein TrRE_jg5652 [Triparma retinervis]|uniref:Uncharacterized protein n=1 Tax=Triparma retinervis TaxID=2557542 RepID=A0A9W7CJB3_9STRA|nr:hypothetical protein TrRE_jg5652 [Triparma retinervis]